MRLFLGLLLISVQAFAVPWSDLEEGHQYTITQSFDLPMLERSESILNVMKGQQVIYSGLVPVNVPGFPMILYQFAYKDCPGIKAVSDIEIVLPTQASGDVVKVGAQLDEYCVLQFYVNGYDWQTNSIFE